MKPVDYSAFQTDVSDKDIEQYKTDPATKKIVVLGPSQIALFIAVIITLSTFTLLWLIFTGIVVVSLASYDWSYDPNPQQDAVFIPVVIGIIIVVLALIVGGTIATVIIHRRLLRRAYIRFIHFKRFTDKNNLEQSKGASPQLAQGMLFQAEGSSVLENWDLKDESAGFGNLIVVTGYGRSAHANYWGYIRIRLPRELPQIVLESKAVTLNVLPSFSRGQAISLEGNFDKYFTLYAPEQYKQEALEVIEPDFMALLIDTVASYDVEISGNELYVYSPTQFKLTDMATLQRIFAIISRVGGMIIEDTASRQGVSQTVAATKLKGHGRWIWHVIGWGTFILILFLAHLFDHK